MAFLLSIVCKSPSLQMMHIFRKYYHEVMNCMQTISQTVFRMSLFLLYRVVEVTLIWGRSEAGGFSPISVTGNSHSQNEV